MSQGARAPAGRVVAVDVLRGAAAVGMVAFHARWDAGWLGLARDGPVVGAGWALLGDAVAALFLGVSGASLVLADRRGTTVRQMWRRLGVLAGAAAGLTVLTLIAAPDRPITFGILHCLVLGNLLAWPLVRRPPAWPLGAAAALLLTALLPGTGRLDGAAWAWLGLGRQVPPALDYRPLVPWAGFVLLGVVLARFAPAARPPRDGPHAAAALCLAWAGRHSLAVYLLHQAVLFPILALVAAAVGVARPGTVARDWRPAFERQCRATCEEPGTVPAVCAATCRCVESQLASAGPASGPPAFDKDALAAVVAQCLARSRP